MGTDLHSLISIILGITKSSERFSTLQLALERARYFCGYDGNRYSEAKFKFRQDILDRIIEGEFPKREAEKREINIGDMFVSLLLYLNCLEQLGTLFYSKNNNNGITETLQHAYKKGIFLIDYKERDAIKAIKAITRLRHALAHNYGLVSLKSDYKYSLSYEDKTDLIEMPKNECGGNCNDKGDDSSVVIAEFKLQMQLF